MATQFDSFIQQPSFNNPNPIYNASSNLLGNDIASFLDPIGGALGGLFGGDDKKWKSYIDDNGNLVWDDPRQHNPVQLTQVPGARLAPGKSYLKMAEQVKAITDLLPFYSRAVAGQIIPNAQAQLEALKQTQPGFDELARQHALFQVGTDSAALSEAQRTLIPQALEAAKLYDPEYFKTREITSARLNELLKSIGLDSGLTDVERREIEQSLAQQGGRRGTYNAPSNLETVSNAMQYGQAGRARLSQNRNELSQAISAATAALPAFKSGVDVFQVATGKSSTPNLGAGAVNSGYNASNTNAGGIGSNMNQLQLSQMQINANKKDWADYMNQVTSSLGDLGSLAGGIAACWVARRVFGEDDLRWRKFRLWLATKASSSLRKFYIKNGPAIAFSLTSEQCDKLRLQMNKILEVKYV